MNEQPQKPAFDYLTACVPVPYQVLGRRLKPFCLGHFILMRRFGCAFVSEQPVPAKLADLVLGVAICSHDYRGFCEFIQDPNWLEHIREFGCEVGRKCPDLDLNKKVDLFLQYLKDGAQEPEVFFESENTRHSEADWTLSLHTSLIEMGYRYEEALNLPLSQAFYEFYKSAETKGLVTFAGPESQAVQDPGMETGDSKFRFEGPEFEGLEEIP